MAILIPPDPAQAPRAEVPIRPDRESTRRQPEADDDKPVVDSATVRRAIERTGPVDLEERSIHFSFNEEINRVIIKVTAGEDEEVIRQIPPEEYVKLVSSFRETIGILFDETA